MVADGLSKIDTLANDRLVSKRVDYEASPFSSSELSNAKRYVPVEGEIARTYRPLRQEV